MFATMVSRLRLRTCAWEGHGGLQLGGLAQLGGFEIVQDFVRGFGDPAAAAGAARCADEAGLAEFGGRGWRRCQMQGGPGLAAGQVLEGGQEGGVALAKQRTEL